MGLPDFNVYTAAPIIIGIFLTFNFALVVLIISYDTVVRPSWVFVLPLVAGGVGAVDASRGRIEMSGARGGGRGEVGKVR